jgi:hypothetical protein
MHVYDTATFLPVVILLRPGATPSGSEIRGHLRRLARRIRRPWPNTRLTIRGDGHHSRPQMIAWCEANGLDHILALSSNAPLFLSLSPTRLTILSRPFCGAGPDGFWRRP